MRFSIVLAALFAVATASPTPRNDIVLDLAADDDDTKNDVVQNAGCKGLTVIFARGTTEPGNMGVIVGPPMVRALQTAFPGQVAVQGVKYPASIPGYLKRGDKPGGLLEAKLAKQALQQCPNTKVIISGYSQGGYLTHRAAENLDSKTAASTMAVIFGDPLFKKSVGSLPKSRTLIICHKGDDICGEGKLIKSEHLNYAKDVDDVVKFVTKVLGQLGSPLASAAAAPAAAPDAAPDAAAADAAPAPAPAAAPPKKKKKKPVTPPPAPPADSGMDSMPM